MPVVFPEFGGGDEGPRGALVSFVRAVHDFLAELIQSNRDRQGQHLFLEDLLRPMGRAWQEVEQQRYFADVERGIERLTDGQLRDHGLFGWQLAFKLAVIRFFHQRYLAAGKGILRKLLDIIDDLLKSILEAIGGGGAIAEIKDFIKDSIDE